MTIGDEQSERAAVIGFMLDERVHVFVHDAVANERFLESVDPNYWQYQADVHSARLGADTTEERQRSAAALRLAYGQGVETLFAVMCAFVQCPQFPLAWLTRYQNRDLRSVVRKIHEGVAFASALRNRPSWEEVASVIFQNVAEPQKSEMAEGFSKVWRRLAEEFLSEYVEPEYNSLKHGMRAAVGGFSISVGAERKHGEPAPTEQMQTLGGSEYASTFWMPPERLDGTSYTFELRRNVTRAWIPEQFVLALPLIGMSIANVISRALISAGANPTTVEFKWPRQSEAYSAPWQKFPSISNFTTSQRTDPFPTWREPSESDIRSAYGQRRLSSPTDPPRQADGV